MPVTVILQENIKSVGKKFDIINVSEGYAVNFLFPNKKAIRATSSKVAEVEKLRQDEMIKKEEIVANASSIAEKLNNKRFTISEKVSKKGHLYKGITQKSLIDIIADQAKVELHKENVILSKGIKELGDHSIKIQLTDDISADIVLEVKGIEEK